MQRIVILFVNGGLPSTAILPLDIFKSAGTLWNALNGVELNAHFDVVTASADGKPVVGSRHVTLTPEMSCAEVGQPDLAFVAAGGLEFDAMVSHAYDPIETIAHNEGILPWLKTWHEGGATIVTACSGALLAAAAGLLDGKRATAHWGLTQLYSEHFPDVDWREEYLVTDCGDVVCGGGVNAAADVSLYLVEKFCGREIALKTARSLCIEMPRTWQNSFTHFELRAAHEDEPVLAAEHFIRNNFAKDLKFDAVAKHVGMSPRNFARRFKDATGDTPLAYLHGLRIAVAKQLLETSPTAVAEIGQTVGYVDPAFFRQLFQRKAGITPSEYRRRFGRVAA
ncbi:helix-turn-helix domain-containing protein [Altererythrobacter salegens]|uniref:Helix-turn-helix domain-containing protein n=1 Tax=Croceibacterium salegens TaxID=1737568 RepID=A0A6I4SU11_9SPHN|nr:helix-turn-helix domain-containing protein [Croceibacterium salegens]MXO59544.1 helix-turn-helix domain-containing protein [Croceibacterium salegens]